MKYPLLFVGLLLLSSCVPEPQACFEITTVNTVAFEPVKFTSCSEDAHSYKWDIEGYDKTLRSTEENPSFTWDYPGDYEVTLEVRSKNNEKKDELTKIIKIEDVCYTCVYTQWSGTETHCAAQYPGIDTKSQLMARISFSESLGAVCTTNE